MYDWEITEEPDGKILAFLCGTQVTVRPAGEEAGSQWRWEVRYADGQTQTGVSDDSAGALEKAKRVAEHYMP